MRAAIKPIPTLTKPLRSVDTETKQPAQALRERTDSTVVPAAAVVAEAMVASSWPTRYREKFGGDHIDDVLAAVDAYRKRIDWRVSREAAPRRLHRLHGRRQVDRALAAAPRGRTGDDRDRRADRERELGMPVADAFARDGEQAFRAREADVVGALLGERRRRRDRARRRQRPLRAGARRARAPHRRLARGRRRGGLARVGGTDRPLARERAERSTPACERAPLYESARRRDRPDGRRGRSSPRAFTSIQPRRAAAGHEDALGRQRLGRVSGLRRPRPARRGRWPLDAAGGASASATHRRRPLRRPRSSRSRRVEVEPGEAAKTMAEAERVCAGWLAPG